MQKPLFEQVKNQAESSILVNEFKQKAFDGPYHYHPELELTLIVKGCGQRIVGCQMERFSDDDLILLGKDLPHKWASDIGSEGDELSHAVVVQFSAYFLGTDSLNTIEFQEIKKLLESSKSGISFFGETSKMVKASLIELASLKSSFDRLILALKILNQLANSKEFKLLDQTFQPELYSDKEMNRRNLVFTYLANHFKEEVSLAEVAGLVHLTPNAFCKYFKKITRKSFFDFVIDFRIRYVKDQLVNTEKSISEICFESGFGNLSHFNKTFKSMTQTSPLQYRKRSQIIVNY